MARSRTSSSSSPHASRATSRSGSARTEPVEAVGHGDADLVAGLGHSGRREESDGADPPFQRRPLVLDDLAGQCGRGGQGAGAGR
jgi:hypothetical protein